MVYSDDLFLNLRRQWSTDSRSQTAVREPITNRNGAEIDRLNLNTVIRAKGTAAVFPYSIMLRTKKHYVPNSITLHEHVKSCSSTGICMDILFTEICYYVGEMLT